MLTLRRRPGDCRLASAGFGRHPVDLSTYLQGNPIAARRVARAILLAGDSLEAFPKRGRVGRLPGTRELLAVHPYQIVYLIEGDVITIARVWHGAQIA